MDNRENLLAILEKEEKLLQELLELEEQMGNILVEQDGPALQRLNLKKERLAAAMGELENKRAAVVPERLTLKEYLGQEEPSAAARLEQLRQSILGLYHDLQQRQKINRRLLLFNRRLVEQVLYMFMPSRGDNLYSAGGEKRQAKALRPGLLDSNA